MIEGSGLMRIKEAVKEMTEIVEDLSEIFIRLFDARLFTSGEINFILEQFELNRCDRETQNLIAAIQGTTEINANTTLIVENNLPQFKHILDNTVEACENLLSSQKTSSLEKILETNRETRKNLWINFIDDMSHKCSIIDTTFAEKEQQLSEFYSDLESKLCIHK